LKKLIKKYVSLISKIPERHYFTIFVIISLYFVVPYSEFVVTALALLYFVFEKQIRWFFKKLPVPEYIRYGGSLFFFLVMIDDYLFYFAVIAFAVWSSKQVKDIKNK
jgi:hypothetical protein